MPLPVIADIFRVEFNFLSQMGAPGVQNVLNVRCTTSGDPADVADVVDGAMAGLSEDPWDCLSEDYVATTILVTPLDGSTAGLVHPLANTPQGGGTGDKIMQGAGLISLRTTQRGSRGRGRLYIGPITEEKQDSGIIGLATQTAMTTGWGEVFAAMLLATPRVEPGVASYLHADWHELQSLSVDRIIATQRRRLDAIR